MTSTPSDTGFVVAGIAKTYGHAIALRSLGILRLRFTLCRS